MKQIITMLCALIIAMPCYAADMSSINKESIDVFLEIFPQYKEIVNEYGNDNQGDLTNTIHSLQQDPTKLNALFEKYGITMQDFAGLMQKITVGFSAIKMQQEAGDNPLFAKIAQLSPVTPEEKSVLSQRFEELKNVFEVNDEATESADDISDEDKENIKSTLSSLLGK